MSKGSVVKRCALPSLTKAALMRGRTLEERRAHRAIEAVVHRAASGRQHANRDRTVAHGERDDRATSTSNEGGANRDGCALARGLRRSVDAREKAKEGRDQSVLLDRGIERRREDALDERERRKVRVLRDAAHVRFEVRVGRRGASGWIDLARATTLSDG